MAYTGVIPFETAAALVLGENIGTTITTLLASIGTTINAKRAAYAHMLFNIIGVLWVTALFVYYYKLVLWILPADPTAAKAVNSETVYPNVTAGIAIVHSVFNIANVILFLPFVKYMARFLERVAPDKPYKETPKITQLDIRHVETPSLAIEQSYHEIVRMMDHAAKMEGYLLNCVNGAKKRDKSVKKLFHREEILNNMQEEITVFLSSVLSMKLTQDTAKDARVQLRLADECESVGDYITNILKYWLKLEKANVKLPAEEIEMLKSLRETVFKYRLFISDALKKGDKSILSKAENEARAITYAVKECRNRHLRRVEKEHVEPLATVVFNDTINAYRRIKDHLLNMAEAFAEDAST